MNKLAVVPVVLAWVALTLAGCAAPSRPPQFIGGIDLRYPPTARADGIEGRVVVRYDVTVEGTVANASVVESEPSGIFDEAALAAVQSWRFRPMLERGEVVPAPGRVSELLFRLGASEYDDLPVPKASAP